MKIALIDYGVGNLFSVERALKFAGADYYVATKPEQIIKADKLVLPGVGAFADGMKGLKRNKLDKALQLAAAKQIPLLGICLGMQILMETGNEFGSHQGLGIIPGSTNQIKTNNKLPHIGWNNIRINQPQSPLLQGIKSGEYFYFVHSYVTRPAAATAITATTKYGQDEFCSILSYNHTYGTQFHPEKSGPEGLKIYQNFIRPLRLTVAS